MAGYVQNVNLILISPPLSAPTAPALGPAVLAACVKEAVPGWRVEQLDLNLDLYERAINGQVPDLCAVCPTAGLACPRPGLLSHRLPWARDVLRRVPRDAAEEAEHMRAAVLMDGLTGALRRCSEALLRPWVEGRRPLPPEAREAWLAPWLERIAALRPDVVGISILGEANLVWGLAVARAVREELNVPVLFGGSLLSHLDPVEFIEGFPWLDVVFVGEADRALPELLRRWGPGLGGEGCGILADLAGVVHRRSGSICIHPPDHAVDLDALPTPDFGELASGYLVGEPVLPYVSGRGCYWGKCTFCSHTRPYGGTVRYRAVEKVAEDLRVLQVRHGVRHFLFVDEAIPPAKARRLFDAFEAAGLDLRLGFEGIRSEPAWDAALLQRAHAAGVRWIYVGVESFTQRLLDLIEKGTKTEDILAFLARCEEAGLVAHVSYILGLPSQTEPELQAELHHLRTIAADAGAFALLDGSPMYRAPERFGLRIGPREVLLRSPAGPVHGPRFDCTTEAGLTPAQAESRWLADPAVRRIRSHLGECAAVVLSETGFFRSHARPPDLDGVVARAFREGAAKTARDAAGTLDRAACLETSGGEATALELLRRALATPAESTLNDRLRVHAAACRLQLGQVAEAVAELSAVAPGSSVAGAVAAQDLRIGMAAGDLERVEAAATRLLALGLDSYRLRMARAIVGAAGGRYAAALVDLDLAREWDGADAELMELTAHCHERLGHVAEAGEARARAESFATP